jgi:hypothetical protein
MLRITTEENGRLTRFRLEGQLKGDWVRELERCWSMAKNAHTEIQFFVELSNVNFVYEIGRALLSRLPSQGATLEARNNMMTASLVEEIVHGPTQSSK